MKTSAEKSSATASRTTTPASNQPFFAKAGGGDFFAPAVQMKMTVNQPGDKFEQEADKTAEKVMRMAAPAAGPDQKLQSTPEEKLQKAEEDKIQKSAASEEKIQKQTDEHLQKQEDKIQKAEMPEEKIQKAEMPEDKIQKAASPDENIQKQPEDPVQNAPAEEHKLQRKGTTAAPAVSGDTQSSIRNKTGGQALGNEVRGFMEPRFNADFSAIRVHHDAESASLNNQLSARAFTYQNHIFFSRDQYQPGTSEGKQLLAHELTHTIQQGHAVQRSPQVSTTATTSAVQRGFFDFEFPSIEDIRDGLADLAANVPGFTLLTVIIGRNPINQRIVERNAMNILHAFIALIPGGNLLFRALESYGVAERLGTWITAQTNQLGLSFGTLRNAFSQFIDSLDITDVFRPSSVWQRAQEIFRPIIDRVTGLISGLISQAITWLKETFAQPLSDFCNEIPGFGLIKAMLGRDPFTNTPVPSTPLSVVRSAAEFIEEGPAKVDQLVESRALDRAYQWFMTETRVRNLTWARVVGTFAQAWNALSLESVLHPIETLRNIVNIFRPLFVDLVGFVGSALLKLLEFIYEAAMGAGGRRILDIFMRARGTFVTIIRNPVGFLRHLLGAIGRGIRQFSSRILIHLRSGVIAWLTGPVARSGIEIPEHWDLRGIIWFVLQILGLTWTRIREKLVRLMGERPVAMLESGFELIQEIRERGIVQALRERVTEFFGNLREAALGAIRSFIQTRLVQAGIQQLLSLLTPVGAVVQAIIKTYTTIQFFIQRIHQILDLFESIVNSISAIASGAISAAANFIERTMARTLPVILDFLARFIGLGDVGAQVQQTIRSIQGRVDQMLDRAVEWIRNQARRLASRFLGGDPNASPQERLQSGVREGVAAVNRLPGSRIGIALIRPVLSAIRLRHNMQRLDAEQRGNRWAVVGVVNPTLAELTEKDAESADAAVTVSAPQYFSSRNPAGWGTRMLAIRRTPFPVGSRPSITNPAFDDLNIRRDGSATSSSTASFYVLGHLLNERLGGPGNTWGNLTPLSRSGNAQHETQVENQVKASVDRGNTICYEVRVNYGRAASPLLGQISANTQDPVLVNKRKVLEQEQYVASGLDCVVTELDANTLQPLAGGLSFTRAVSNPLENSSLNDYNVPGQAALRLQTLALNDSIRRRTQPLHEQALKSLPGIGETRFAALVEQTYPSWRSVWTQVNGITEAQVAQWRSGLPGNVRVVLNGTTTWV